MSAKGLPARNPLAAMVLSYAIPGLGHLYVGRAGIGLALGLFHALFIHLFTLGWTAAPFDVRLFSWAVLVESPVVRLVAAFWAAGLAFKAAPEPKGYQTMTAYGLFVVASLSLSYAGTQVVTSKWVELAVLPQSVGALRPGEQVWVRKAFDSQVPQVGKTVAFFAEAAPTDAGVPASVTEVKVLRVGTVATVSESGDFSVGPDTGLVRAADYIGEVMGVGHFRSPTGVHFDRVGARP